MDQDTQASFDGCLVPDLKDPAHARLRKPSHRHLRAADMKLRDWQVWAVVAWAGLAVPVQAGPASTDAMLQFLGSTRWDREDRIAFNGAKGGAEAGATARHAEADAGLASRQPGTGASTGSGREAPGAGASAGDDGTS